MSKAETAPVTIPMTSAGSPYATAAFWEWLWRTAGIQFTAFCVIAYVIYGYPPGAGASSEALVAFYGGNQTRVLIAAFFLGLNTLNLMWFAAALRATLADSGQDGWGSAATAASAAFGGLYLLLISVDAALAYSISGSGNTALMPALNDIAWALVVLSAFPRAMLCMSAAFGFWRAGRISNSLFAVGVLVVVLGVLGGSTWLTGFWAPDGLYSRFVLPTINIAWMLVVSGVLLTRSPATRAEW